MKKLYIAFMLTSVFFLIIPLNAQWIRLYLGEISGNMPPHRSSEIRSIQQTDDGGYIVASNNHNSLWILKLYTTGLIEWQKQFQDILVNRNNALQTSDLGFIITGDRAILKLLPDGQIQWQRYYSDIQIHSIQQTADGGYIVAGNKTTSQTGLDVCILKISSNGEIEWQKAYGGELEDSAQAVQQTSDGGYIFAGYCTSLTPGNAKDVWIVKINSAGSVEWQKNYGGLDEDYSNSIQQTSDGGYVVGGFTRSFGVGDWVLKINSVGNIEWQKTLGTFPSSIQNTKDGGYIVVTGPGIIKLTSNGSIDWQKELISDYDEFYRPILDCVIQTAEDNYIAAGFVSESDFRTHEWGLILNITSEGEVGFCNYIQDANFVSQDTSAIPADSHIIPENLNILINDTSYITSRIFGHTSLLCPSTDPKVEITLSPNKLGFGAVSLENKTQEQTFLILRSTEGLFTWNITDDSDWLSCSPISGSGEGKISVTVDPGELSEGIYSGIITVNSPEATSTPKFLEVVLNVYGLGMDSPPFGFFETPISWSTVSGSVPVTGWALDDIGVESVQIWRDKVMGEPPQNGSVYIGDAIFVEGARPDVEQAYVGFPLNNNAGWGYMLLTNAFPNQGSGYFTLHAFAFDTSGAMKDLGEKIIYCDNANAVKPFGAIDTPTQGGDASGSAFLNWGWALTPQPNQIPMDGSTIDIYVNGVNLGHPIYNLYREDVAALFPDYKNSGGAVGYFSLDTTAYTNGVHTIYWIATDDASNADGIGSRYFSIQNAGGSAAVNEIQSFNTGNNLIISYEQITNMSIAWELIKVKKGFRKDIKASLFESDPYGVSRVEIREIERVEIEFGKGVTSGFMVVGDHLRPLPIGSTLDAEKGKFYWMPGPGFIGEYDLVFIKHNEYGLQERINIKIKIRPKFGQEGVKFLKNAKSKEKVEDTSISD